MSVFTPPNNALRGCITLSLLQIRNQSKDLSTYPQMSQLRKRQIQDFIQIFLSTGAQLSGFCREKGPGPTTSCWDGRRRCRNWLSPREAHWQGCAPTLHSLQWAHVPMGQHPGDPASMKHMLFRDQWQAFPHSWQPSAHEHPHMLSPVWGWLEPCRLLLTRSKCSWLWHQQGQTQQDFCLCFKRFHKSLFNMHLGMIYHLLNGLMASCTLWF